MHSLNEGANTFFVERDGGSEGTANISINQLFHQLNIEEYFKEIRFLYTANRKTCGFTSKPSLLCHLAALKKS